MIKALFWLIAAFAAAAALAIAGRVGEGYVLVVVPPWRVEVSLLFALLGLAAAFAVAYALTRIVGSTLALPAQVRSFRERRKRAQAQGALAAALQCYFEGRYARAEREAAPCLGSGRGARNRGADRGARRAPDARIRAARPVARARRGRGRNAARGAAADAGGTRARRTRFRGRARRAAQPARRGPEEHRRGAHAAARRARRAGLGGSAASHDAARQARRLVAGDRRGIPRAGPDRAARAGRGRARPRWKRACGAFRPRTWRIRALPPPRRSVPRRSATRRSRAN